MKTEPLAIVMAITATVITVVIVVIAQLTDMSPSDVIGVLVGVLSVLAGGTAVARSRVSPSDR